MHPDCDAVHDSDVYDLGDDHVAGHALVMLLLMIALTI